LQMGVRNPGSRQEAGAAVKRKGGLFGREKIVRVSVKKKIPTQKKKGGRTSPWARKNTGSKSIKSESEGEGGGGKREKRGCCS